MKFGSNHTWNLNSQLSQEPGYRAKNLNVVRSHWSTESLATVETQMAASLALFDVGHFGSCPERAQQISPGHRPRFPNSNHIQAL
jgi:hypothetical protein